MVMGAIGMGLGLSGVGVAASGGLGGLGVSPGGGYGLSPGEQAAAEGLVSDPSLGIATGMSLAQGLSFGKTGLPFGRSATLVDAFGRGSAMSAALGKLGDFAVQAMFSLGPAPAGLVAGFAMGHADPPIGGHVPGPGDAPSGPGELGGAPEETGYERLTGLLPSASIAAPAPYTETKEYLGAQKNISEMQAYIGRLGGELEALGARRKELDPKRRQMVGRIPLVHTELGAKEPKALTPEKREGMLMSHGVPGGTRGARR